MTFPAIGEWLDMMPDSVVITEPTGRTVTGAPDYTGGTPVTCQCYIEMRNHLTVDRHGREVVATGRLYLASTTAFDVESKLQLPAGSVPRYPTVIAMNLVSDDKGVHHVEVEIG